MLNQFYQENFYENKTFKINMQIILAVHSVNRYLFV